LNEELELNLPITGYFGPLTLFAVREFQEKYSDEILGPWNLNQATGIIFTTTINQGNKLRGCQ
jgi:peptidoglycan hydrolase-like protein with peptidoglycan-binding domain